MSAGRSLANAVIMAQPMSPDCFEIQCHENDVPPFVDATLQSLYSSLYSSLAHRRIFNGLENANTYVVRQDGAIVDLWLFQRSATRVQVLSEGIPLDDEKVARFCDYIFARYPSVGVISFHAVQARLQRLSYPHQCYNCLEDMVLTLPSSAQEYLSSLGRSTRSYINRYQNRLRREFPSFEFCIYKAHEIEEQYVRRVIEFNRVRMSEKGKVSINDESNTQRIVQLAMECGMVCVIRIDGKICAGTVNYRIGSNYFLEVIAHDPEYNDYRLGTICCYLTICECIANGAGEYHLLWGQDEYKSRMHAVRRDLDHVDVYRSPVKMLLNADKAVANACGAQVRKARLWLRDARRRNTRAARWATLLLRGARSLPRVWF